MLSAEAKEGEGVFALLRRYELVSWPCNVDQFYLLNGIPKDAGLVKGKAYLLPVEKKNYNGINIRSSIGITDFTLALQIQQYNERMQEVGNRRLSFRDDKELWVPHHLLHCRDPHPEDRTVEIAAAVGAKGEYPIFGEKYSRVVKESDVLAGQVFYISSGHGGPDPGAIGHRDGRDLCEDEYAYDVSLRLCRHLISRGAIAYMIIRDNDDGIRDDMWLHCDQDEVAWGEKPIPRNQVERLYQRASIINALFDKHKKQGVRKQTSIFIHVDSNAKGKRQDVFFYHAKSSREGKVLAETLQQTFKEKYNQYQANRGYHGTVTGRDLYLLRETLPVGVYIELANIRNPDDQRRIIIPDNREALAKWLADGLVKGTVK